MGDDDGHPHFLLNNDVIILLIVVGSAAFIFSTYHVIAICLRKERIRDRNSPPTPSAPPVALAHMIVPTYYHKKIKAEPHVGPSGGTCAVCLGDFEEGEELKTLPECMHSFHVPCIETWLSSHSSCPTCRAGATPSLEMLHSDDHRHSIDVAQFEVVHSGFMIQR